MPKDEVIYRRQDGWMPVVIRKDDLLYLRFAAGADANHEPRTFYVPIAQDHLEVITSNLTRHILLWSALLPIAEKAGTNNSLDEGAAIALRDFLLLKPEPEVEAFMRTVEWRKEYLIAHRADPSLVAQGKLFKAAAHATDTSDPRLAQEYMAQRRHLFISPLNESILRYTGQYLHGGTLPSHNPEAVSPDLLPQVDDIIKTAVSAASGIELPQDYGTDYKKYHERDKQSWNSLKNAVENALRATYPLLSKQAIESVSFLICSDEVSRVRKARNNT